MHKNYIKKENKIIRKVIVYVFSDDEFEVYKNALL